MSFDKLRGEIVFPANVKAKKRGNKIGSLGQIAFASTAIVSTVFQPVSAYSFNYGYDGSRNSYYIEAQDGVRAYYDNFFEFVLAWLGAFYSEIFFHEEVPPSGNSVNEAVNIDLTSKEGKELLSESSKNEADEIDAVPTFDDSKKSESLLVEAKISNDNNDSAPKEENAKSENSTKNVKKVASPEIEKAKQKLEADKIFLGNQKDDDKYERSHEGECELLRSFHFEVGCVLAKRITWLRHKEIAKKIDEYNKELYNEFGVNSFSKLFIDVIKKLRKAIENSKIGEDEKKEYKNLLNNLSLKNLRTDLHMFKNFFTDEDFKILSEEVELLYSDRHKEIRKLHVENCYYTGAKNDELYGYDVSSFSEKDVEEALKKFKEYKAKYLGLVNENSKKSEFYIKYIPEFFKLEERSTADKILDCYINWWKGNKYFEHLKKSWCPNNKEKRLEESGFICRLFYPQEWALSIISNTVRKAVEDRDFCSEYDAKEQILENRAEALELEERQFEEKQPAPLEQENNNANLFESEAL